MGKFPILYGERTVSGRAPSVRADLDVSTGEEFFAGAFVGVLEAIKDVRTKYHLMDAKTQLDDFKFDFNRNINELSIYMRDEQDASLYQSKFNSMMEGMQTSLPKNRLARREAEAYLKRQRPALEKGVESSMHLRFEDNFKATGFNLKTEAERTGKTLQYQMHLETGKLFDVYSKEEAVKLLQDTEDKAVRNLAFILADKNLKAAIDIIDKSELNPEEKTDLKKEVRNNAGAAQAQRIREQELILRQQQEKAEQDIVNAFMSNQLQDIGDIINASSLEADDKYKWFTRVRDEAARIEKGEDIVVQQIERSRLRSLALGIWTGAVSKDEFYDKLNKNRFDTWMIDDATYKELSDLALSELKAYQAKALSDALKEAERQLLSYGETAWETLLQLASGEDREQMSNRRQLEYWNISEYDKEIRDWLTKNPDATRDDFYIGKQKLLAHYRKRTPSEIRAERERKEELALQAVPTIEELKARLRATKDVEEKKEIYEQAKELGYWK